MVRLSEIDNDLQPNIRKVLLACRDAVRKEYPHADLILYGSQARGQAQPASDIDLLILLDQEPTSQVAAQIRGSVYDISLANDCVISTIIRSKAAWNSPLSQASGLYKAIRKEGVQV